MEGDAESPCAERAVDDAVVTSASASIAARPRELSTMPGPVS
jgi:hypothetical protein